MSSGIIGGGREETGLPEQQEAVTGRDFYDWSWRIGRENTTCKTWVLALTLTLKLAISRGSDAQPKATKKPRDKRQEEETLKSQQEPRGIHLAEMKKDKQVRESLESAASKTHNNNRDNSETGAQKNVPYDTEGLQPDFLSFSLAPSFQDSC